MSEPDLTDEHRNILRALQQGRGLTLRAIHDALVEMPDSRFVRSPDYGDGWNDERWAVKELRDDLSRSDLVTNDYQNWYMTPEGRELVDI